MVHRSPAGQGALSRRGFLRGSAASVMTPFLAARLLARRRESAGDELRVGLVGCGGRGTGAAAQALAAAGGRQVLTALADVFPERIDGCLATLGAHFGDAAATLLQVDEAHRFAGFDGCDRLLGSGVVDVVLLAAPPHFRPAHLAAAVAAGKHVFCEKPVAVDAPGVRAVLAAAAAARRANLSLVSGFCWRYNVRHRAFYERVLQGDLGELRAVYSTYNATPLHTHARRPEWSDMEFQLRNWQHFLWLSGDHVMEQAVHSLDKQAWALGDRPPLAVTAVGGRQARFGAERGNVYDHFSATFDYAGGVKAFHMCRQLANCSTDNSDFLWGTRGTGEINGWANLHRIEGPSPWTYEGEGNDMYQQELDELFASIRAGLGRNDGTWMTHSTLLALMVRMAAYTGQTVTWEQARASEERLGPARHAFGEVAAREVAIPGRTPFR